ncbi:hypothetical protein EW093_13070 [Thiospirochaeta perfilievii]|uniref:Transcription termination/antitermination protein NusG n=1 Tax=Thiospirochaeta perfilievii TaxID=252967 RepID=A0A5C1QG70_9SPIO|nr:transcription termination/antitermination NusG family protein [Thiospirochaeta perfilievii]QEN05604.1 hypothetical protein EW093_13070 [Thiospirochaeta perfilievii]
MNYYVLQVVTGTENKVKDSLSSLDVINPERKLIIRRKGKKLNEVKSIFPGYIFLKTKENIDNVTLQLLKDTKNVVKILNSYKDPIPLCCNQLDLIKPLLNPNFKAELSNVNFNKDDKIVVINGPLKELEGQIIKVDKRKQRATVQIEMYNKVHKINFSYIDISK